VSYRYHLENQGHPPGKITRLTIVTKR